MVLFLEHFLGSFCWQSYLSLSSLIDYNSYNDLASDACFLSTLYNDNQKDYYYSTFYTLKAIKASKASSCCPIVVSLPSRLQFNLPSFSAGHFENTNLLRQGQRRRPKKAKATFSFDKVHTKRPKKMEMETS